MGMSVGSLAILSSWIGFGIGVAMTPVVYLMLKKRIKDDGLNTYITILNQTDNVAMIRVSEVTNATIAYTVLPSKPEIKLIGEHSITPLGILIDLPIPTTETSLFHLHYNKQDILVEPLAVYVVSNGKIRIYHSL